MMSENGDTIPPEFRTRRLAFYLSIYQEKILKTQQVTDRVQLLDINRDELIGFPSLKHAVDYIISATNKPITSQTPY